MGVAFYYEGTGTIMGEEKTRILVSFDENNTDFHFDAYGVKDWGDGSPEDSSNYHTYQEAGTYVIETNAYIGGVANNFLLGDGQYVKGVEIAPESLGTNAFSETGLVMAIIKSQKLAFGINDRAFDECRDLVYANLPYGVSEIGWSAFYYCSSLKRIHLPESVTKIDPSAFAWSGLVEINIPSSVDEIGYEAFQHCADLVVFVGGIGVSTMGDGVFAGCSSLTTVNLSPLITVLPSETFLGCTALQTVQLPSSLEVIENSVFTNSGLTEITIPNTLTDIGSAFVGATHLVNVTYQGTVAQWNAINKWYTPFDSGITVHCTDGDVTY